MPIIARPTLGDFWRVLFRGCDGVANLRAWGDESGGASHLVELDDWDAIAAFMALHARENLGVCPATRQTGTSGALEDCVHLRCLFVDLDGERDGVPAWDRVRAFHFPPSAVVETSPGHLQAFWALREPMDLREPATRAYAGSLLRRLALAVGGDPSSAEVAHVVRLPGSLNWKPKYAPDHPRVQVR
jgi:hypothetical protein